VVGDGSSREAILRGWGALGVSGMVQDGRHDADLPVRVVLASDHGRATRLVRDLPGGS
jgi:hypothetical protein